MLTGEIKQNNYKRWSNQTGIDNNSYFTYAIFINLTCKSVCSFVEIKYTSTYPFSYFPDKIYI